MVGRCVNDLNYVTREEIVFVPSDQSKVEGRVRERIFIYERACKGDLRERSDSLLYDNESPERALRINPVTTTKSYHKLISPTLQIKYFYNFLLQIMFALLH